MSPLSTSYLSLLSRVKSIPYLLWSLGLDDPALLAAISETALGDRSENPADEVRSGLPSRPRSLEYSVSTNRPANRALPLAIRACERLLTPELLRDLAALDDVRSRLFRAFESTGQAVDRRRASRVAGCQNSHMVMFHLDREKALIIPYSCHQPACPTCSRQASIQRYTAIRHTLDNKPARIRVGNLCHLVLTVQNIPAGHLAAAIPAFLKAFVRFRRPGRGRSPWADHVHGYLWSFEITYNARVRTWHPHIHVLADMDFWPQPQIAASWASYAALRGLKAVPPACAEVRQVKTPQGAVPRSLDEIAGALWELSKYTLKPFECKDTTHAAIRELTDAIKGRTDRCHFRLHGSGGSLEIRRPRKPPTSYRFGGGVLRFLDHRDSPFWTNPDCRKEISAAIYASPPLQLLHLIRNSSTIAALAHGAKERLKK